MENRNIRCGFDLDTRRFAGERRCGRINRTGLWRFLGIAALFAVLAVFASTGQAADKRDPATLYHWAYASAFGTGAYRFGEDAVFAVRIAPELPLRKMDEENFGIALSFPLTLSIQQTGIDEILQGDLPDNFQTLSLVPGIELQIPVKPHWIVKPFGHAGWGTALSGDDSAWIYYAGVNSRYALGPEDTELGLLGGLQYYGYTPRIGSADRFFRIMAGVDLVYRMPEGNTFGKPLYFKPHVVYYHYVGDLDFSVLSRPPVEIKHQWEFAIAFGPKEMTTLWGFRFDRVGIAYVAGSDIDGVRIFFRSVFD